jgi:Flp pilus assembly protein TadB
VLTDILIGALAAILPALIVLKNDKQMVHLLEGKLHKQGRDTSAAKEVYGRHKEHFSFVLVVVGFWILVAGLVALGTGAMGITVAVIGGICAGLGVLGRVRSFRRADQELG